jgi:hypothetical protein
VNVVVMIPKALKAAVDGRAKLNLGLPPNSDVGDLLDTLFTLYPKLKSHVASDKRAKQQHLNVYVSEVGAKDISWRKRLREGQTLYLSAPQAKRLAS